MTDVMIDLETLGNDYDGIFTTIGACVFDRTTGEIKDTFYAPVCWKSSVDAGRTITPDTIKWWMDQSKEAQHQMSLAGSPLEEVLERFAAWIPKGSFVWGNGSNFDIGKLETAYGYYNIPWAFWAIRDVRTVCDLAEGIVSKSDVPFEGTRHNALDDAIYQAKYVSAMIAGINDLKKRK